jgi:hypothetical protein
VATYTINAERRTATTLDADVNYTQAPIQQEALLTVSAEIVQAGGDGGGVPIDPPNVFNGVTTSGNRFV